MVLEDEKCSEYDIYLSTITRLSGCWRGFALIET